MRREKIKQSQVRGRKTAERAQRCKYVEEPACEHSWHNRFFNIDISNSSCSQVSYWLSTWFSFSAASKIIYNLLNVRCMRVLDVLIFIQQFHLSSYTYWTSRCIKSFMPLYMLQPYLCSYEIFCWWGFFFFITSSSLC